MKQARTRESGAVHPSLSRDTFIQDVYIKLEESEAYMAAGRYDDARASLSRLREVIKPSFKTFDFPKDFKFNRDEANER